MSREPGAAMWMPAGLMLFLAACGGGGRPASAASSAGREVGAGVDWRRLASRADRDRLRAWRTAWTVSLTEATATQEGAQAIAADPALFDPDRVLTDPLPPVNEYRCRTIKLGRQGSVGLTYIAYGWFRCRVASGAPPVPFAKVNGSQRQSGLLYEDAGTRAIFLGTLTLGDEARAMGYGRDRRRDLAGIVERIGPQRWRIAFPYPAFESTLDILELRPAD